MSRSRQTVSLDETSASSPNTESVPPRRRFLAVTVNGDESSSFERALHGLLICSASPDSSWSECMDG